MLKLPRTVFWNALFSWNHNRAQLPQHSAYCRTQEAVLITKTVWTHWEGQEGGRRVPDGLAPRGGTLNTGEAGMDLSNRGCALAYRAFHDSGVDLIRDSCRDKRVTRWSTVHRRLQGTITSSIWWRLWHDVTWRLIVSRTDELFFLHNKKKTNLSQKLLVPTSFVRLKMGNVVTQIDQQLIT